MESKTKLQTVLYGQFLSFILALASAANEELSRECRFNAPATQLIFVYFLLSFYLFRLRPNAKSNNNDNINFSGNDIESTHNYITTNTDESSTQHKLWFLPLSVPSWTYLLIALLDLEANYITIQAYHYTNITNVTLLDAFTIPTAMVVSKLLLKRVYRFRHILGAGICIGGLIVAIYSDMEYGDDGDDGVYDRPHNVKGDMLALFGAILYGTNNTLTEYFVKEVDREEYLGMLGFCGLLVSVLQAVLVERDNIDELLNAKSEDCHIKHVGIDLSVFVIASFILYTQVSRFLMFSEAALLNLSFLTADLWAVLFSVFAEGVIPSEYYFIALISIFLGVYIYETAPSPMDGEAAYSGGLDDDFESPKRSVIDVPPPHIEISARSLT